MTAIIARPSVGATRATSAARTYGKKTAPAAAPAAVQSKDLSDWRDLIRHELDQAYELLATALHATDGPPPSGLPSELSSQAEVAIRDMLVAEDTAAPWEDDITAIAALDWPCFSMQAAAILQQQATGACTVAKAYSVVSNRLIAVCAALELTHDLAAMAARLQEVVPMPIRTNPHQPVRVGHDYEDNLAEATGAVAVIGRNMPGYVLFESKACLIKFVEKSASQAACLNLMLAYLVNKIGTNDGPDGDFVADFADFVSDQVYEHQQAVGALLKAGSAA